MTATMQQRQQNSTMKTSSSRGGIDYSKWDNLDDDSCSSNRSCCDSLGGPSEAIDWIASENGVGGVHVTRLAAPARITIRPSRQSVMEASPLPRISCIKSTPPATLSSSSSRPRFKGKLRSDGFGEQLDPLKAGAAVSQVNSQHCRSVAIPVSWIDRGSYIAQHDLYWAQDRYNVYLRFFLPTDIVSCIFSVQVEGIVPYSNRHCAILPMASSQLPVLTVFQRSKPKKCSGQSDTVWFSDKLPFPVHSSESTDHRESYPEVDLNLQNDVEWRIETVCLALADGDRMAGAVRVVDNVVKGDHYYAKYLMITLPKASPVPQLAIWWRQPTLCCPLLDVDQVPLSGWQLAWQQAHKQFQDACHQTIQHNTHSLA